MAGFDINTVATIILSVGGFGSILIGVFTFTQGRRGVSNNLFSSFVIFGGFWIGIAVLRFYYYSFAGGAVVPYALTKLSLVSAISVFFLFLLFVYSFPQEKLVIRRWLLWAIILSYGIAVVLSLVPGVVHISDEFIFQGNRYSYNPQINWGKAYAFYYTPLLFLYFIMGLLHLVSTYRRMTNRLQRTQVRYLLLGDIFGGGFGIAFGLFLQFFPAFVDFFWVGRFAGFVFVVFSAYAVLRYHLFDIKVIATELSVFAIWLFFLIRVAIAPTSREQIIDIWLFFLIVVFGIFLIRSALKEVKQKEKLAELNSKLDKTNADLKDLNEHLEQKVDEQTVEIKRAYEVEKKARIELEELDKAKDQFILTTQHHLRTPLTIVKGYLQSIGQKARSFDESTKTYVAKAQEATERISALVNELLDVSQMEVGKSIIIKESTNIKRLVENVVKELEAEIQKRNITINVRMGNDTVLNVDPHKISEGLTNIIDNAVKYNKEGGSITVNGMKTTHPIERDKQIYRLTIEDTGIGLIPEELAKLFDAYFQRGEEAEKLYTTGRGIGLSVTKNIITAHGGRIYAESEGRNKGARFTIELPA